MSEGTAILRHYGGPTVQDLSDGKLREYFKDVQAERVRYKLAIPGERSQGRRHDFGLCLDYYSGQAQIAAKELERRGFSIHNGKVQA